MKYHEDELDSIGYTNSPLKEIEREDVDRGRWHYSENVIFQDTRTGRFYEVVQSFPATECQECDTYADIDSEGYVECREMKPVIKPMTVYVPV